MVQRLEKGCHNLDHLVLQWESHFPATKQQFHSNPRFNKSYFVYLRSIHDSWHECMILISELGANLRYELYFEMRSELRTPPCWNAFSQCKMVWWLFERNSSLPNWSSLLLQLSPLTRISGVGTETIATTQKETAQRDQLEEKSSGVRSTLGSIFAVSKWQKILHSILPK